MMIFHRFLQNPGKKITADPPASLPQVLRAPLHPVAAHHRGPSAGRHCQAHGSSSSGAGAGGPGEAEDAKLKSAEG